MLSRTCQHPISLGGLKGKDVIVAVRESYGQVAVQNTASRKASTISPCEGDRGSRRTRLPERQQPFSPHPHVGNSAGSRIPPPDRSLDRLRKHGARPGETGEQTHPELMRSRKRAGARVSVVPSNDRPQPQSANRFITMDAEITKEYGMIPGPEIQLRRAPTTTRWPTYRRRPELFRSTTPAAYAGRSTSVIAHTVDPPAQ
jgi:hypothetical protein